MIRIGWNKRLSCQLALAAVFGIRFAEGISKAEALCAAVLVCALFLPLLREKRRRECGARAVMLIAAGGLAAAGFLAQEARWKECEQTLGAGQEQTVRGTLLHREEKNGRLLLVLALPDEKIQLIVSTEECVFPLGSALLVTGTVEGFGFPRNEGQFNEREYYKSRQAIGRMRAEEVSCVRAPTGIFLWRERLFALRAAIARVCASMLPAEEAGILAAMLAGEKSLLDADVSALFQRAGVGHILAVSGLHVSVIGMGVYALLRGIGLGYASCAGLSGMLLFCYGTMAGMGVSTQRAVFMFFAFLLATCIGRGYDARAALGASAFVLLLYRPFVLHSVSFQFSFAAAYALVGIGGLLKREEGEEKGRLFAVWRPVCAAFLLQLCILPLTAYYDYELPLYALFLNLLLLPYAGAVMGFGLAGCAMALLAGRAAWTAAAARMLFVPCRMILSVYVWACRGAERLPFSGVVCGRPPAGKLLIYYALLAALLFALEKRRKRFGAQEAAQARDGESAGRGRETRAGAGAGRKKEAERGGRGPGSCVWIFPCGALLLAFLCRAPQRGFEVSFLDVGQGDGSFIRTSEGVTCFVDGGSTDVSGVGTYRILPFLKSKGVQRVDYWLLSHLDEDHVRGFYEVLAAGYPVGAVVAAQYGVRDEAWERLTDTLAACGVPLLPVCAGDVMQLQNSREAGGRGGVEPRAADRANMRGTECACISFLAPGARQTGTDDRNAASLVFLFEEQGFRALWTGDIGTDEETRLLTGAERFETGAQISPDVRNDTLSFGTGPLPAVDVYKAAHHGSDGSNSAEFLRAAAPRLSVVSCAAKNRYGHPGAAAMERMRAAGGRVLCTMDCGQVKITKRGGKFSVKTAQHF